MSASRDRTHAPVPTRLSRIVALGAAGFAALAVVPGLSYGLPVVLLGAGLLWYGTLRGDRAWLSRGFVVAVAGAFAHAAVGGSALSTLACVLGAIVAWDVAGNGIDLAAQLGEDADVGRAELAHAGGVTAVGATAGGVAYLVYLTTAGSRPLPALVLLLFAALALVASLRSL